MTDTSFPLLLLLLKFQIGRRGYWEDDNNDDDDDDVGDDDAAALCDDGLSKSQYSNTVQVFNPAAANLNVVSLDVK